jgi:hypothetical protein
VVQVLKSEIATSQRTGTRWWRLWCKIVVDELHPDDPRNEWVENTGTYNIFYESPNGARVLRGFLLKTGVSAEDLDRPDFAFDPAGYIGRLFEARFVPHKPYDGEDASKAPFNDITDLRPLPGAVESSVELKVPDVLMSVELKKPKKRTEVEQPDLFGST